MLRHSTVHGASHVTAVTDTNGSFADGCCVSQDHILVCNAGCDAAGCRKEMRLEQQLYKL